MRHSGVQAVVMAAGKGTRMRSRRVKVLHRVLDQPLLEHVLRAVAAAGAAPVTVVVGHQAEEVEKVFAGRGYTFVRQEPPLGTGHAVQVAGAAFRSRPERTLLVVNGDVPLLQANTLQCLLDVHRNTRAQATVLTVRLPEPGAYGRVLRGAGGAVTAIVEARDATPEQLALDEINTGVYAFEVDALLSVLGELKPQNAQGEYYLTDVIGLLVARGLPVQASLAPDAGEVLGVNSQRELADASLRLKARILEGLLEAGVRVEAPDTVWVGPDCEVAPDATLRAGTLLEGHTRVGAGATVGPYSRLVDVEVGEDAQVLDHCFLRECRVGAGAAVGPFAHIRPESVIGARAKVGNFVELKKTSLGEGSKVPHLSYVGDATVGPAVNIGAGTITCNYDGVHKHPTRIDAGAFVGSNSTLVAPVTIGEGAYVGAGSAVTADVPARALALGRARQVVKEGWAEGRPTRGGKHS